MINTHFQNNGNPSSNFERLTTPDDCQVRDGVLLHYSGYGLALPDTSVTAGSGGFYSDKLNNLKLRDTL